MDSQQGDLALLQDPVARKLLNEQTVMRLAYTAADGSPRVVPHWFLWNGTQLVLGTPPDAPKVGSLRRRPQVAATIDTADFPAKVLLIRGTATVEIVDGMVPEYAETARRYFGAEQGEGWTRQVAGMFNRMARVAITPEWVGILDFEARFPSAFSRAMARAGTSGG